MKKGLSKGVALIEAIVGIGIAAIVVVGIMDLSTRSTGSAGLARRQTQASTLARERMEWVRNQKEASEWTTFCGWGSTSETLGEFTRSTSVVCGTDVSGKENMTVHVTVNWTERGNSKQTDQEMVYIRY